MTRPTDDHAMPEYDDAIPEHYDGFAEAYAEYTEAPIRVHVTWPAVRSLLPAPDGLRALDAGCGPGTYSRWLAERGADVVGVDASAEMVRIAREAHGDVAVFREADLREPVAFADDGAFDLVLSTMVLSHLPELGPVLEEFARVLAADGSLVVATHHPFHDYLLARESEHPDVGEGHGVEADPVVHPPDGGPAYHDVQQFGVDWSGEGGGGCSPYYRRPLSDLVGSVLDAGFELAELLEPEPGQGLREASPEAYAVYREWPPGVVCLRANR